MFNLLSTEDKKIIKSEYSRRLVSVIFGILLFIFVISLLFLTPILINVYSASNNAKVELEALKSKPASSDYRDLEDTIKEIKLAMDILKTDMTLRPHIAGAIIEVLKDRSAGISIENISWFSDESGIRLNINGTASSRELLRKYVLVLQSNKSFFKVDIPVSAFAKAEESNFSIMIKINEAK